VNLEEQLRGGTLTRARRVPRGHVLAEVSPIPKTTIVCHGDTARKSDPAFEQALRANASPVERVLWTDASHAVETVRHELELRGDRYVALVDARCALQPNWLDELIRQAEWMNGVGAATYAPGLPLSDDVAPLTADARCTLLSLRKFPQHHRLRDFPTLDGAIADFLIRAVEFRSGVRGAASAIARVPEQCADKEFERTHGMPLSAAVAVNVPALEERLARSPRRRPGLVSIVMLSWNAPQFTKLALESIRTHTSGDYEVIIVDNGSNDETVQWLRTLRDVRVIYNASNRGYAGGNNQAMAAANGEYVVLLNNDVIVTQGWLDDLLDAFNRIPALGVSAPRSNKIAGDQIVLDATYNSIEEMHRYAAERRRRYRRHGYMTDRAIGLCLCIDRRVIEEIGGIDERFGVGNFEDDDFCLRVRAAGYNIHVCDDVFIHHFGSQTFAANKIDWTATMRQNWEKFAAKWGLPPKRADEGYVPGPAIRRGFDRSRHYVPLPSVKAEETQAAYDAVFAAVVRDERDWNEAGAFAKRYMRAFCAQHRVLFAIAAIGELAAATIGQRLERLAQREGLDPSAVADVEVADEDDLAGWLERFSAQPLQRVMSTGIAQFDDLPQVERQSPSALRRLLQVEAAG
jgi:GT2 family glycosyltransferase